MDPLLMSAGAAILVFVLFYLVVPKATASESDVRKRSVLERISQDAADAQMAKDDGIPILRDGLAIPNTPLNRLMLMLPGSTNLFQLVLRSGYGDAIPKLLVGVVFIFLILVYIIGRSKFGIIGGVVVGLPVSIILLRKFLKGRIASRNAKFINQFPDAIDMIVRSVRSGHPLNTAMRMITDNMDPPITTEFRQVTDEVAYGRTLPEALGRLSQRIDEPDLQFFVVVLSVQQETGGNLAEVLSNLSNIIRKRRQLRLKIKAMTSEGRATAYILGGLPVVEFTALYFLSPGYLDPLFSTTIGNILLATAIFLVFFAAWVVKQMCNIDI